MGPSTNLYLSHQLVSRKGPGESTHFGRLTRAFTARIYTRSMDEDAIHTKFRHVVLLDT